MDGPTVASLLMAGAALLTALVTALRSTRDSRREDQRLSIDADATFAGEARLLRGERAGLYQRAEEAEQQLKAARSEITDLRSTVERLERLVPLALVSARMSTRDASTDLGWVLDHALDLFVITSPADRGRFLWVNASWERVLGWERTALLGSGWRALLHPDDIEETRDVETRAWTGRVDGAVIRYRCQNGRYALLRWYAASYDGGVTLAIACHEGYDDDDAEAPCPTLPAS